MRSIDIIMTLSTALAETLINLSNIKLPANNLALLESNLGPKAAGFRCKKGECNPLNWFLLPLFIVCGQGFHSIISLHLAQPRRVQHA